jgi:hypothetical protein
MITTSKNIRCNSAGVRALSGTSFKPYRAGIMKSSRQYSMLTTLCQYQIHADSHPTMTTVPVIPVIKIDEEIDEEVLLLIH